MFDWVKAVIKCHFTRVLFAVGALLVCPVTANAAEAPRSGGELVFAVGGTPPSFDGHRETTFAGIHPVAPHYSTLLRFDPENYPKIVGDVAESWTISGDGSALGDVSDDLRVVFGVEPEQGAVVGR